METPGFSRAMGTSQDMLGVSQARAAEGVVMGNMVKGTKASACEPLKMPPKPFSAMPAISSGYPLTASLRPIALGSPANLRCQYAYERIATGEPPGATSSAGAITRPAAAPMPSAWKYSPLT